MDKSLISWMRQMSLGCILRELYISPKRLKEWKEKSQAEYNSKRARWEGSLRALHDDILIFDNTLYESFQASLKPREQRFIAETREEGVQHPIALRDGLQDFPRKIAENYRHIFEDWQREKKTSDAAFGQVTVNSSC
jgi:hypothetical protein